MCVLTLISLANASNGDTFQILSMVVSHHIWLHFFLYPYSYASCYKWCDKMNCSVFLCRCCAQLIGPAVWGWARWMDNVPPCHLDPWQTPQGSCQHQRVVCPGHSWLLALDSWSACSNKKKKATWQHSSSVIRFEYGEEWGWVNFDFFFKEVRLPLDTGYEYDWCGLPVFSFLFLFSFSFPTKASCKWRCQRLPGMGGWFLGQGLVIGEGQGR